MGLALARIALGPEVPQGLEELMRLQMGDAGLDLTDLETYRTLALAFEKERDPAAAPDDRLLPFELLQELEDQAEVGLSPESLDRLLQHAAASLPLWRAALRQWDEFGAPPAADARLMLIALLGETAGADVAADLLWMATSGESQEFRHANWAVWRLGQRFPAETLAALREAGSDAGLPLRCALAEHIARLPDTPGRPAAAVALLQGFAKVAREDDAPFLLAAVIHALELCGRPTDAERAFRENQKLLPKEARRWLRDALDEGFEGRLGDEGIEGATIEEICSERILMEEEEDEEEDDLAWDDDLEEEEDEDAAPFVPPVKPGRNDPCWCGSGKKYKKCHLAADEEAERAAGEAAAVESPHERLYGLLLDGMSKWFSRADLEEATRLFFDLPPEDVNPESDDDRMSGFFDWCIHDFRPRATGRTLIDECLRRRAGSLSRDELELLEAWKGSRFGIWEVQRVEKGSGVELKDWFEQDRLFVHDVSSSRSMVQWDCVLSRVYRWREDWYFSGNGFAVPRTLMAQLAERIERESRDAAQNPAAFVRSNSQRWHREVEEFHRRQMGGLRLVNAEGDELEFGAAEYAVEDEDAVAAALERAKPFEAGDGKPGVRSFAWLEQTEGPRRSYGRIEIRGGGLRIECNSRKRLVIGRQLVEKHAGAWLRHLGDTFTSLDELKRRAGEAAPPRDSGLPPEVERDLLLKLKTEHYARWVDEPLPALDGRTPREAMGSASGRRAVEDLLRLLENGEERARLSGDVAYDVAELRRLLGM